MCLCYTMITRGRNKRINNEFKKASALGTCIRRRRSCACARITPAMRAALLVMLDKCGAADEQGVPDMFTEGAYDSTVEYTGYQSWWHLQQAARSGIHELIHLLNVDTTHECFQFPQQTYTLLQ